LDVVSEQPGWTAGDADVVDDTLSFQRVQRRNRAIGCGDLSKTLCGSFRIVQVDQWEVVEAEQSQAVLHRATRLVGAEVASEWVAVGFGGQDETGRQATSFGE